MTQAAGRQAATLFLPSRLRKLCGPVGIVAFAVLIGPGEAAGQALPLPDVDPTPPPPVSAGPTPEERAARDDQDAVAENTGRAGTASVSTSISGVVARALQPALAALAPVPGAREEDEQSTGPGLRRRVGQAGTEPFLGLGAPAIWASAGATFIDNDFTGNAFDGEVLTPLIGADITSPEGWVAGLSLGYEGADLDTAFNDGTLEGDGFLVSPYAGYVIAPFAMVDAGLGYARLSYDRVSRQTGQRVASSFDGDRVFAFTNLTAYAPPDLVEVEGLTLSGKFGFRYSREDQDGFREGTLDVRGGVIELGTLSLGARAAWRPDISGVAGLELFARVAGEYDAIRSDSTGGGTGVTRSDDRSGVTLGAGAVLDVSDRLSLDLGYDQLLGREDLTQGAVTAGLRFSF